MTPWTAVNMALTDAQALGWQQRKEQQRLDNIQHAKLVQQR